jgi:hypothetical protein
MFLIGPIDADIGAKSVGQKALGTGLMSLETPRYSTCPQGAEPYEPTIVLVVVLVLVLDWGFASMEEG